MNVNWITQLEHLLDPKRNSSKDDLKPPTSAANTPIRHANTPINYTNPTADYSLNKYYLKKQILDNYKKENINELYPWQHECLIKLKEVQWEKGENFLFVAPTSGGKTLVAEIFAFEQIEKTEKIFFLFPLNSLINEKIAYFKKICIGTDIKIGTEFTNTDIILCTYEKLNSYLNKKKLVCTRCNDNIREEYSSTMNKNVHKDKNCCHSFIVIIDEFHLISERGRGIYIENIISKILYLNKKRPTIKIISMSGTLDNLSKLREWMNARIYVSSYRPQEIKEHYICNGDVYKKEKEVGSFSYSCSVYDFGKVDDEDGGNRRNGDISGSGSSCERSTNIQNSISNFLKGRSLSTNNNLVRSLLCFALYSRIDKLNTLIFCSTKKNCEYYINIINNFFLSCFPYHDINIPEEIKIKRRELNDKIYHIDKYTYDKMNYYIHNGICYYYSDISNSIKKLLELAYKEKTLFLLTCTSTLSVGLNLRVDRVLISSPFIADNFLTVTQYKQMIGRAARLNKGDSFLFVEKKQEKNILDMFKKNFIHIKSTMNGSSSFDQLEKYIIEFICLLNDPMSFHDIVSVFSFSLYFIEIVKSGEPEQGEGGITGRNGVINVAITSAANSAANCSNYVGVDKKSASKGSIRSSVQLKEEKDERTFNDEFGDINLEQFTENELIFYERKKKDIHYVVNKLIKYKCIEIENKKIRVTNFCKSLCISNFTISFGVELLNEIKYYDKIYLYNNSFHLCYICSSYNLNIASFTYYLPFLKNLLSIIFVDNYTKHIIFQILKFDSDIINMLNLKNQNMSFNRKKNIFFTDDLVQKKYNKLYLSILLFLYLKGNNISLICSTFKITEEVLQTILHHTYIYIHILISFFDQLDQQQFKLRSSFGEKSTKKKKNKIKIKEHANEHENENENENEEEEEEQEH
ncbi:DEAD/DEAH box helicase [Plasmodium brasilianum]|uniref:DEAD/DEAH box helicase n=1 Tax=Plasmodium brasilianum TaxID=5824 RepID=A0ACB9Y4R6_PLABR|nr:DEAD/DEAH box helicase [Plasmodium brasilianum]